MIMPLLLVELGDNNTMFSADLQQNKPEWMKRGVIYELCMISANFACLICKLIFDTTTELKVHILNTHDSFSCIQCKVKFGVYEELLAHNLTFCKYPALLLECNWCMKSAVECICAKIQTYVLDTMQEHIQGKLECKLVANNMYSVIFYYACEKATLKSNDPNFEKGDIKDFT